MLRRVASISQTPTSLSWPKTPISTIPLLALLLSLFASLASAQVGTLIDSSKLPSCATNCPLLVNAQNACIPPAAPTTNQATYQTCFCSSAYLAQFKTTALDICGNAACSPTDLQKIQVWYSGLCAAGAVVTPSAAAGATASASKTSSTTAPRATVTNVLEAIEKNQVAHPNWIQTHWRWLIMVIVLIIAAMAGIFGGLWFKRRQARKYQLHNRDSMLAASDGLAAMRSRHPDAPGMASIPRWSGAMGQDGIAPVGGYFRDSQISIDEKGKERMDLHQVRDMGVGGDSSSSVPTSVDDMEHGQPPPTKPNRLLGRFRK